MTIQTRFDIGQEIWWRTYALREEDVEKGSGEVVGINIKYTSKDNYSIVYEIKLHNNGSIEKFIERDIYATKEELDFNCYDSMH